MVPPKKLQFVGVLKSSKYISRNKTTNIGVYLLTEFGGGAGGGPNPKICSNIGKINQKMVSHSTMTVLHHMNPPKCVTGFTQGQATSMFRRPCATGPPMMNRVKRPYS